MKSELVIVILTKNEEQNLTGCLDCIPSRFPIVVIDSGSTDRTVQLARDRGCEVIENEWAGFVEQRNFAIRRYGERAEWILFVDADEQYPEEFFDWFRRDAAANDAVDVVMVPSKLFFKGTELRHAPGYPIYHPRLVRPRSAWFIQNHSGHGEAILGGLRITHASIEYRHYFFSGELSEWMQKHVRNAALEYNAAPEHSAHVTKRARLSARLGRSVLRAPLRFLYHYLVRQGFRDGRAGLQYSLMYAWYEMTKYVMLRCRHAEVGKGA